MGAALEGSLAVDASGHVAGPYAGSLLGDLGCDVIKVEPPGGGDSVRGQNPQHSGYSPTFRVLNRNKRSITLNLRAPEGRAILLRLLEKADILIENFRPGTRKRLGFDYEQLAAINPRLVHCSITAFGQSGPYADRPGFESIGQALSGMLSLVTELDRPRIGGLSIAAHATGLFAVYGILAALIARGNSGRGQFVDASLLQGSMGFAESHFAEFLNGGAAVTPRNFQRGRLFCLLARDDLPLVVHLSGHQKSWEALAQAVERRDFCGNPMFATARDRAANHDELLGVLQDEFRRRPRADWLERLEVVDVSAAPIYAASEVFGDPQVRHLGLPREIRHSTAGTSRLIGNGVNLSDTPARLGPAPLLGENTDEVLRDLGFDRTDIEKLRTGGVI